MQPGPGSRQRRDVAVGPSRVVAARVFGTVFDDAHITSYADFSAEVDPAELRSVGLVGDVETSTLLADLLVGSSPPQRVLLGLAEGFTGRDELLRALAANPGLRPADLLQKSGVVVVRLGLAAEVDDADAARVVAELQALEPTPSTAEVDQAEGPAVAPSSGRPLLSRLVSRLSRAAPREP